MGTASYSVGRVSNQGYRGLLGSGVKTSGTWTTSTTASNIEDAIGDISLIAGDVLQVHANVAMRFRFAGVAATSSTGHYVPADVQREFICEAGEDGFVSAIDLA